MTNPFQQFSRRVILAVVILVTLLSVGTAGYRWLEGLSLIDALYMTVITISTVGFGEVKSLSPAGRIFTITLIIGGGGLAAFSISSMADYFFSGEWRKHWETRRRLRMVKEL